ncbi:hypothetical protein IWW34DRAFT_402937 [Fusarium oxysporum f. sp. albedinis]|nr:hypothetical protein IWW34DRAFT_402937 [Fusarium oxysporum f. sp. albedinis]KAK2476616.1 hypothetical protein H9L39_11840 [Fusarium oxysporum f. sp. albedinis]
MLLVLVPLLCFALPHLNLLCLGFLPGLVFCGGICLSVLLLCFIEAHYHCTRPVPLFLTLASACASSLFAWTGPFTSWFEISVDRSLLSHSQALHLHPFAGLDPEPKPNQSAPQRNSIPIRYLDLPKAASTAILTCLQPPQSAIKQYSPTYSPSLDLSSLFRPILPDTYLDSTFSAPQPPALLP